VTHSISSPDVIKGDLAFNFLCLFCVVVHFFWLLNACFCCVRVIFSIPGQTSPKWPVLCRVRRKTIIKSIWVVFLCMCIVCIPARPGGGILRSACRQDFVAFWLAYLLSGCWAGQNVNRPGRDSVNFATWARLVVRNSLLSDDNASTAHSVEGLPDDYFFSRF